mgnify:FL=1
MAKKRNGKQLIILAAILILPSLLYVISTTGKHNFVLLPFYGPKELHPTEKVKSGAPDTMYYKIPSFEFEDVEGGAINPTSLDSQILVFSFFCTDCTPEGKRVAEQMASVQAAVEKGGDVTLVSFTVDPENDNSQKLQALGEGFNRNENIWKLISAPKTEVYNFAVDGLLIGEEDSIRYKDGLLQSNTIVLVDHNGHIRGYFDGIQYTETKELKDAIQQLRYLRNVLEPNLKQD